MLFSTIFSIYFTTIQHDMDASTWEAGGGGHWGLVPLRFCNKQGSGLSIFRKCSLLLKEQSVLEVSCPQAYDASFLSAWTGPQGARDNDFPVAINIKTCK